MQSQHNKAPQSGVYICNDMVYLVLVVHKRVELPRVIAPRSTSKLYEPVSIFRSHLMPSSYASLTHFPSAAYMRQWTGSALVQVMACRLFGAKPLPEPMLT